MLEISGLSLLIKVIINNTQLRKLLNGTKKVDGTARK